MHVFHVSLDVVMNDRLDLLTRAKQRVRRVGNPRGWLLYAHRHTCGSVSPLLVCNGKINLTEQDMLRRGTKITTFGTEAPRQAALNNS